MAKLLTNIVYLILRDANEWRPTTAVTAKRDGRADRVTRRERAERRAARQTQRQLLFVYGKCRCYVFCSAKNSLRRFKVSTDVFYTIGITSIKIFISNGQNPKRSPFLKCFDENFIRQLVATNRGNEMFPEQNIFLLSKQPSKGVICIPN